MAYSSIIKPSDYFNTKLYTGTGAENAVTGVGFQPDFTWLKNRATTNHHTLFDAVRGANKVIYSNLDAIQYTVTQELKSFDSDGFTVGTEASANGSGNGIVSWNWKANGQGSANSDGTITTTYTSADTTSGFSIVRYTGTGSNATVGHGLGAVPKMIIVKCLDQAYWWFTYHVSLGDTKHITLNTTNAASGASAVYWNNTTPTSSVFSIGTDTGVNQSGQDYIAYCFADVQGFSKFGSYTGNGSTDAPFIYTGFKPSFIMLKNITTAQDWQMYTFDMQPFNEFCTTSAGRLKANTSDAQSTKSAFDMLSNGFKMRTSASDINASGNEIIYMAFAKAPFVSNVDGGLPTTAR
jgi:hypothetical protein